MRSASPLALCLSLVVVLGLSACGQGEAPADRAAPSTPGVDLQNKVLRIGALNDESGPVAVIGRPYAFGKRILAAEINAGGSGLLPEGWKVELIERDHGYNPQRSVQTYNEIR
jgi:ABC-type branched-subunit amino acid transport system substrate-binding protein